MKITHLKRRSPIVLLILFILICARDLSAQVKLSEESWTLPTYHVNPASKAPIFFTNGNYQGASKYIYPLALNDIMSPEKVDHDWKALILENEYIKLCVTPEIGGKLYYAEDKTSQYNFIYKNDVVKPANIGMTGAWVSGGIEWCVFHHHRASTFLHVDYTLAENEDGSKTIFIGETEPRHRMKWSIGITLTPGKSYFEAEVKLHNPNPVTNSFLYWANVAAHTNEDYQTIFPPSVQVATFHAKNSFTRWPLSTEIYNGHDFTEGVDISWWKNVKNSNSFFAHDLKEDFMGGYDHGKNAGTVHIGDHNIVKGTKLWEWGSGPRGQATEARLTDGAGPYVELMVGSFSDNQPDYSWIKPYETKTWKHYWYPVKDIGGFVNANLKGAVNMEQREGNHVFLGYYSTQKVDNARIILRNDNKIILEKDLKISPEKAFIELVDIGGTYNYTDLSTEMIDLENKEVLVSYQPVEIQKVEELPEIVEPPLLPEDLPTIEEVYLAGKRIEQFYNPRYDPMDYYEEALRRDPSDIRTNIAVGNHFLKNGDYTRARLYLSNAIRRLTDDYTRPSDCEALYLQGLTLKELGFYDEAIDTLYRATWDYAWHSSAYFELAQISCMRGDYSRALAQINESLSTNIRNSRAIGLKAAIQRRMGNYDGATTSLAGVLDSDPLNFRLCNENYLIAKESGNIQKAEQILKGLSKKLRNFNQNYLEVAAGYIEDGMLSEAEDILLRFEGEDPIISYYLGFIYDKKNQKTLAKQFFDSGQEQSEDYCFPYRLQTINVLETALKYNPEDGKACYYIGNILFDKQPEKAMESWEKAVEFEPGLAIAFRNLGWGYHRHYNDVSKAIPYYEKAISLDREEPIYYSELDVLYEISNAPVAKRQKLFEGNNEIVKKRDDSFVREMRVLTLSGQPEKALEYMEGKAFSYREGSSRVREIIIDAQLSLGLKYYNNGDFQKALDHFLMAQVPDEEAGGSGSGNREIQVCYYIGRTYDALENKEQAKSFYTMAIEKGMQGGVDLMGYYLGLNYMKLGEKKKAEEIFMSLVTEGEKQLNQDPDSELDFFAKFGERETENTRVSNAYTIKGLGHKGLGQVDQAEKDLEKAVELKVSNLWAYTELNSL
jgi:tetratricopeptide (TPR) repeat protein